MILATIKVASCCCCEGCHGNARLPLVRLFCFFFLLSTAVTWKQPWRECIVSNTPKDLRVKALLAKIASNLFWKRCCYGYMFDTQQWNRAPSPGPAVFCAYLHLSYTCHDHGLSKQDDKHNRRNGFLHFNDASSGPKIMHRGPIGCNTFFFLVCLCAFV